MIKKTRALLGAAIALVAFSAFASTASAIDVAPGGDITMISLGDLVFDSIVDIECPVTLTGDLAMNLDNEFGEFAGTIENDNVGACDGAGEADALVEDALEWDIRLREVWDGPRTSIGLFFENAAFAIYNIPFIGDCLFRGEPAATINTDGDATTGLVTSIQNNIPFSEGEDACPPEGRLVGQFTITLQELDLV